MDDLDHFITKGSVLLRTSEELKAGISRIRAVLFDWDGVFNDGFKDAEGGSPFSEVDSMGVNLLRFSFWLRSGKLPIASIITGQHNPFAERYAQRERLHDVFMGYTHKSEAFEVFLKKHALRGDEVAFFFDDVLDLPVAEQCGMRLLMGHASTHLFQQTCVERGLVDIIVPQGGGRHGLREACELMMSLNGNWNEVVEHRMRYTETYQRYLAERQQCVPQVERNPR